MRVIPRLTPDLMIEPRDLTRLEVVDLKAGEISIDTLGITHRKVTGVSGVPLEHHGGEMRLRVPDARRFYEADPRTLPPGIEGRPMLTVVHEVDGLALGGFTYLVTVIEGGPNETAKPKLKGRATTRRGATRTGSSARNSARSSARAG
jgi:hypothetical protein